MERNYSVPLWLIAFGVLVVAVLGIAGFFNAINSPEPLLSSGGFPGTEPDDSPGTDTDEWGQNCLCSAERFREPIQRCFDEDILCTQTVWDNIDQQCGPQVYPQDDLPGSIAWENCFNGFRDEMLDCTENTDECFEHVAQLLRDCQMSVDNYFQCRGKGAE